jgi:DNA-binding YbaB/EbfC family protein
MLDIFGKLGDLKKKMDEIRSRLDAIYIDESSQDGNVKVTVTGNRKVKSIYIDASLLSPDRKEELEEVLETQLNRALDRAEAVSESEMKSAGRDMLPGMPGLF